jgi:outer membrane protein
MSRIFSLRALRRPLWLLTFWAWPAAVIAQTTPPCPPRQAIPPTQLADLLTEVLCADARTQLAWQQIQLQSARLDGQRATQLPELGLRLDSAREAGALAASSGRSHTARLELGWLLLDGGRREAATRAAGMAVSEAMAQRDSVLQTVLLDTAQAYHAVLDAQRTVQVRQALRDSLAPLQATVQQRHRAGQADHTDLLTLRQAHTRNQIALRDATLALAVARARLSTLTGRPPDHPWPTLAGDTPGAAPDTAALAASGRLERGLAQALAQHPELAAAQARVGASRAALDQAERAGRPSLGLSQSIGRGRRTGDSADGSPTTGSARQTTLALSWPLFDGGVRQSQQQAARIELDSARTSLDDQRQRLGLAAWEAYLEWRTATAVQEEHQELTRIARGLLFAENARYQSGGDDAGLSDLLTARQDWTDALVEQQQAHSRQRLSAWRLAASLGPLDLGRGTRGSVLPTVPAEVAAPPVHPRPSRGCQPGVAVPGEAWCVPR